MAKRGRRKKSGTMLDVLNSTRSDAIGGTGTATNRTIPARIDGKKKVKRSPVSSREVEALGAPSKVPIAQQYGIAYPHGTPYQFHQPVRLRRKHQAPAVEDLAGTYDVLLESHVDGDDPPSRLTVATGSMVLTMERPAGGGAGFFDRDSLLSLTKNGRALFAEMQLGDDGGDGDGNRADTKYTVVANKEWTVETELKEASLYFITTKAPEATSGRDAFPFFAGSIGLISERSAIEVLSRGGSSSSPSSAAADDEEGGSASGSGEAAEAEEEYQFFPAAPFVKPSYAPIAEGDLRRYQNVQEHWLSNQTSLPVEVAGIVRQFLFPPPAFFFEEGDLWIYAAREKEGRPSHSIYVARNRCS